MAPETHVGDTSKGNPGESNSHPFSHDLVVVLEKDFTQKTLISLTQTERYSKLSPAQQDCVTCFLEGTQDNERSFDRLARNHRRLDLGAWLTMYHLPLHPQREQIIKKYQQQFPHVLPHPEDRLLLERACCLHRYITQKDHDGYVQYIQSLPAEEQSLTIQSYKHLIIGSLSHANTRSIYFPYLPAEKTPVASDIDMIRSYDDFPLYETYAQRLIHAPEVITAPRSKLQDLFHDLLFLSSITPHINSPATLDVLIKHRSHESFGIINSDQYTGDLFFPQEIEPTDLQTKELATTFAPDPYLTQSYTTISTLRTTIDYLLENRAVLHETYHREKHYLTIHIPILKQIREEVQLINKLHGRVDIQYIISHFVNSLDDSNIIQNHLQKFGIGMEPDTLILRSSQKNALIQGVLILKELEHINTLNIKITSGLDNYEKQVLLTNLTNKNIKPYNEFKVYQLIELLQLIPSNTIIITNDDVSEYIKKHYNLNEKKDNNILIPLYAGSYQEEGICCTPEVWITTLEQCRSVIHVHAAEHGYHLTKYGAPFDPTRSQQLSSHDFCYRIVDYLRTTIQKNQESYDELFDSLRGCTSGVVRTLDIFLTTHDNIFISNTSTDEHMR